MATIIIKPIKQCNACCRHCSVDKNNSTRMKVGDVVKIVKNLQKLDGQASETEFIWHGGEPMLMGPEFYWEVQDSLNKEFPDFKFKHSMQSNLLLYNSSKWKDVFRDVFNNWCVSSSYDFFSSFRQVAIGDYYEKWVKKAQAFQKDSGGRPLYVITVLSKENVEKVIEICQLAKELNLRIKLNHLYETGNGALLKHLCISPFEYGEALKRAFKFWVDSNFGFEFVQGLFFANKAISNDGDLMPCPHMNRCVGHIYGVEPNGDFYNCSEAADLKLNRFGNLLAGEVIYENIARMKSAEAQIPAECIECGLCQGGCKKQKYEHTGILAGKTPYCETWKTMYAVVREALVGEKLKMFREVVEKTWH